MSTIERALEKKRLQEESERQKQTQAEPSVADKKLAQNRNAAIDEQVTFDVESDSHVHKAQLQSEPTEAPAETPTVDIDISALERHGMVTPTENFSQIKEEYRYIKRPLINKAFGQDHKIKNGNLILVSSSFPREGKTFTAINLAISMVLEQDRTVLLVDADVVNPNLCSRLNIQGKHPGLMDYLDHKASVKDIILTTNIPKLKIITAGKRRYHHANEMLAGARMKNLMTELSTRYSDRVVIFDTAPLLGASETNVLAQMAGQAVIVVEQNSTSHQQLERALRMLPADLDTGLILNKAPTARKDYYGYYASSI